MEMVATFANTRFIGLLFFGNSCGNHSVPSEHLSRTRASAHTRTRTNVYTECSGLVRVSHETLQHTCTRAQTYVFKLCIQSVGLALASMMLRLCAMTSHTLKGGGDVLQGL